MTPLSPTQGEPADILARALGFSIKSVTIAGESELSEAEILAAAGIGPRNSLPFLDVASVRERLRKLPLVKEVAVTKFYPDRLMIEIEERQPSRFVANGRGGACRRRRRHAARRHARPALCAPSTRRRRRRQYEASRISDAARCGGRFARKIRAGVFVSGRRWNFKMADGVDVLLPETKSSGGGGDPRSACSARRVFSTRRCCRSICASRTGWSRASPKTRRPPAPNFSPAIPRRKAGRHEFGEPAAPPSSAFGAKERHSLGARRRNLEDRLPDRAAQSRRRVAVAAADALIAAAFWASGTSARAASRAAPSSTWTPPKRR